MAAPVDDGRNRLFAVRAAGHSDLAVDDGSVVDDQCGGEDLAAYVSGWQHFEPLVAVHFAIVVARDHDGAGRDGAIDPGIIENEKIVPNLEITLEFPEDVHRALGDDFAFPGGIWAEHRGLTIDRWNHRNGWFVRWCRFHDLGGAGFVDVSFAFVLGGWFIAPGSDVVGFRTPTGFGHHRFVDFFGVAAAELLAQRADLSLERLASAVLTKNHLLTPAGRSRNLAPGPAWSRPALQRYRYRLVAFDRHIDHEQSHPMCTYIVACDIVPSIALQRAEISEGFRMWPVRVRSGRILTESWLGPCGARERLNG